MQCAPHLIACFLPLCVPLFIYKSRQWATFFSSNHTRSPQKPKVTFSQQQPTKLSIVHTTCVYFSSSHLFSALFSRRRMQSPSAGLLPLEAILLPRSPLHHPSQNAPHQRPSRSPRRSKSSRRSP